MLEFWLSRVKEKKLLIPVVPIVFYHGSYKWQPRPFEDYFPDLDPELLSYFPSFDFFLVDTNTLSDEEVLNLEADFLINTILSFKHGKDSEYLKNYFSRLFVYAEPRIKNDRIRNHVISILVYLSQIPEIGDLDFEILLDQLSEQTKKLSILASKR